MKTLLPQAAGDALRLPPAGLQVAGHRLLPGSSRSSTLVSTADVTVPPLLLPALGASWTPLAKRSTHVERVCRPHDASSGPAGLAADVGGGYRRRTRPVPAQPLIQTHTSLR
jgi:hypothetical protein